MARFTERHAAVIKGMFLEGMTLDRISEEGVHRGWTRAEAQNVVRLNGWALDWTGRLQARYRTGAGKTIPPSEASVEEALAASLDHEEIHIRRLAVKAQNAIEALRSALAQQEERDASAAEDMAFALDPASFRHGEWSGWITHVRRGIPVNGCGCDKARDRRMQRLRDKRNGVPQEGSSACSA
jgi:hypothetical protein